MKQKTIITFVLLIAFLFGCETDNICIEETTPHLIIRFYNNEDSSKLRKVNNLKITVKNSLNEDIQIGDIATLDSIVVPLNVDLDYTNIYLSKYTTDDTGVVDTLAINYVRDEIFVSRSCGYKTIFNSIDVFDNSADWLWMKNVVKVKANITNENQAHINIYH